MAVKQQVGPDFPHYLRDVAPTPDTARLSEKLADQLVGETMHDAMSASFGVLAGLLTHLTDAQRRQAIEGITRLLGEFDEELGHHVV